MDNLNFHFSVTDNDGNTVFKADRPSYQILQSDLGKWERHHKKYTQEHFDSLSEEVLPNKEEVEEELPVNKNKDEKSI